MPISTLAGIIAAFLVGGIGVYLIYLFFTVLKEMLGWQVRFLSAWRKT